MYLYDGSGGAKRQVPTAGIEISHLGGDLFFSLVYTQKGIWTSKPPNAWATASQVVKISIFITDRVEGAPLFFVA